MHANAVLSSTQLKVIKTTCTIGSPDPQLLGFLQTTLFRLFPPSEGTPRAAGDAD